MITQIKVLINAMTAPNKSVKSSNQCKSVILTSYDIVKVNKGDLKVESEGGEGTTFSIELPVNLNS